MVIHDLVALLEEFADKKDLDIYPEAVFNFGYYSALGDIKGYDTPLEPDDVKVFDYMIELKDNLHYVGQWS